ncbi:unnamed protein product [Soboliphyme baturini]|uniref:Complex I-B17 n=1 Tax=Soboliphyme baturini TaxID=241478 RepID=A0A183ICH6_9BILA|nr:unnamed protein product [Soboliphyme baturini]
MLAAFRRPLLYSRGPVSLQVNRLLSEEIYVDPEKIKPRPFKGQVGNAPREDPILHQMITPVRSDLPEWTYREGRRHFIWWDKFWSKYYVSGFFWGYMFYRLYYDYLEVLNSNFEEVFVPKVSLEQKPAWSPSFCATDAHSRIWI